MLVNKSTEGCIDREGKIGVNDKLGPCHHGMARSQVADAGAASNTEGSCEYME